MVLTSSFIIAMNVYPEASQTLLLVAIALVTIWLICNFLKYRKLPPGPYGLPIVGYFPFIATDTRAAMSQLAKKYGDIFSIKIGPLHCVVINEYELVKKVINNPVTHARPASFGKILPGKGGIITLNGKEWLEERRFTFTAMKDLGMGRGMWESMIQESSQEFSREIKTWNGKPVDFTETLLFSEINNIMSLILGRKVFKSKHDSNYKIFENFAEGFIRYLSPSSPVVLMPRPILKLLGTLRIGGFHNLFRIIEDYQIFIEREIKNSITTHHLDKNTSFIYHYLEQYMSQKRNTTTDEVVEKLLGNITALFLGSVDTTKASMQWLLIFMAAYPEVQEKVHKEIDEIVGKDRLIYWDERNTFPYTLATINEMQRWVAIAPMYPPRYNTEPMEIENYIIPKGTIIISNNWKMMHDSRYHINPDEFKPERFLQTSKEKLNKLDSFLPFSTGKRNCPGEHIAMMTLFLYFSAIMQKFKVTCPEGKTVIFKDRDCGGVRHPISQELCFIER